MSARIHRRRTAAEKAVLGARICAAAKSMTGEMTADHLAFVYRTTQAFVRRYAGPHLKRARKRACTKP